MIKRELARAATPSLFTLANGVLGFLAILLIAGGEQEKALMFLIVAMLLDLLDGQIARRLKTESSFGLELDSLADTISFVVAPASIIYFVHLTNVVGAVVASVAVISGIFRLARFNVKETHGTYTGVSTPLFTVMIIIITLAAPDFPESFFVVAFLIMALSMVSPFKYPSLRARNLIKYKGLSFFILLVVGFGAGIFRLSLSHLVLLEHSLIWLLVLFLLFFESLVQKWRLVVFWAGMIVGTLIFAGSVNLLLIYPMLYIILGAPFLTPCFE